MTSLEEPFVGMARVNESVDDKEKLVPSSVLSTKNSVSLK